MKLVPLDVVRARFAVDSTMPPPPETEEGTMGELPATLTPIATEDALAAFHSELEVMRSAPVRAAELALAVAHCVLETGWFRSCRAFNLGNEKATDAWIASGGDVTYYECGEEFSQVYARSLVVSSPLVTIVHEYVDGRGVSMASVKVIPKHPICRFRAFKSLGEGVRAHLTALRDGFPAAWAALQLGDPGTFVSALKVGGYMTDSAAHYLHGNDGKGGLAAVFVEVRAKTPDDSTGEIVRDNAGDEIGNAGVAEDSTTP